MSCLDGPGTHRDDQLKSLRIVGTESGRDRTGPEKRRDEPSLFRPASFGFGAAPLVGEIIAVA